jgi:thiamine biosynthesis lipoprotein
VNAPRAATEWLTWGVQARVVVTDPGTLASAASLVRGYLSAADAATNRDRADSEIRTFGSGPALEVDGAPITPMFAHFLTDALAIARLTDGKLTPTAGSRDPHSWWKIRVASNRVFSPADVVLDLSATARASSADHCAATTAELLGCGVLVALGGDIAVAGPSPEGGWQIQVQDLPGDPTCQVAVPSGCGIATASTVKPLARESTATSMWRTVSVIAESCAEAAALSRVAVGMSGSAIDWLHKLDRPARLVDQEFRVTTLAGWPDD